MHRNIMNYQSNLEQVEEKIEQLKSINYEYFYDLRIEEEIESSLFNFTDKQKIYWYNKNLFRIEGSFSSMFDSYEYKMICFGIDSEEESNWYNSSMFFNHLSTSQRDSVSIDIKRNNSYYSSLSHEERASINVDANRVDPSVLKFVMKNLIDEVKIPFQNHCNFQNLQNRSEIKFKEKVIHLEKLKSEKLKKDLDESLELISRLESQL